MDRWTDTQTDRWTNKQMDKPEEAFLILLTGDWLVGDLFFEDKQTERQKDRDTNRQRDKHTERQTDRETNRQRDKQTKRQTDKKTNK